MSKVEVREVGRECMCETCVERRGEEQKKEKEELKNIYSFTDKQLEQILAKYPNVYRDREIV